jgi:hypothetical protein
MNGTRANHRRLRLDQSLVVRTPVVLTLLSVSLLSIAATLGSDFVAQAPSAMIAAVPTMSLSGSQPVRHAPMAVPVQYSECLTLLRDTDRVSPTFVDAVAAMLNHPANASEVVPPRPPSLMLVTYRQQSGQVHDIVVQLFFDPLAGEVNVLNADGYVRARLGDELSNSADQLLGLMFHQVVYFGQKDLVDHQQRAFQAALNGDMTLLREETVDPLRVLVVMPHGGTFLPTSLRSRVRGLVVDADLAFGTWRAQVGMVTDDDQAAEQVGNIVAAWREMAMSFADTFASHSSGKQLRDSLKSSTVQVVANRVLASASVDSRTVVRASKEITGHGGGCPAGGVCSATTVAVCHKTIGQPDKTLCVPPSAVAAHLAHGDQCGPCAQVQ